MRIFLDTNVLVSAMATRGICTDILGLVIAEHELVLGEAVISELRRVLLEKFGAGAELVDEAETFLRREGEVASDAPSLGIRVRDEDDVRVLEEAVAGGAEILVTGDRDLSAVSGGAPIEIVTPRGLWEVLRSPP